MNTLRLVSLQDIFEKVNKAYEFLCSKSSRTVQGPDPHNIVLILKSQSILFKRYKEGTVYFLPYSVLIMNYLYCQV